MNLYITCTWIPPLVNGTEIYQPPSWQQKREDSQAVFRMLGLALGKPLQTIINQHIYAYMASSTIIVPHQSFKVINHDQSLSSFSILKSFNPLGYQPDHQRRFILVKNKVDGEWLIALEAGWYSPVMNGLRMSLGCFRETTLEVEKITRNRAMKQNIGKQLIPAACWIAHATRL